MAYLLLNISFQNQICKYHNKSNLHLEACMNKYMIFPKTWYYCPLCLLARLGIIYSQLHPFLSQLFSIVPKHIEVLHHIPWQLEVIVVLLLS